MREPVGCVLRHAGEVRATSTMTVTCPRCRKGWELSICGEHGRVLNLLIARGGALTCVCGLVFPMLYNTMFGVL